MYLIYNQNLNLFKIVNSVNIPTSINKLAIKAVLATKPNNLYLYNMNKITKMKPTIKEVIPD